MIFIIRSLAGARRRARLGPRLRTLLASKGRCGGGPRSPTVINNSQRPLNSGGLFRADAPRNDLFIVLTTVHLAPRGLFFALINRNPRLRGPNSLWPLSANRPVARRRRHRQREVWLHRSNRWQGLAAPGLGAPYLA